MLVQIIIAKLLNKSFYYISKVVEKNSANKEEENDEDPDYGIQYFNKFQSVSYRLNDLIYFINKNKIKSTLCKPKEKKELSLQSGKFVRVSIFEVLL